VKARSTILLFDLAGILLAAALAYVAAQGPEGTEPARFERGEIGEVAIYSGGRLAPESLLRFRIEACDCSLRYAIRSTQGPTVRLAVERGEDAEVGLNAAGSIVALTIDGQSLILPGGRTDELRRAWLVDLMTLAVLVGGCVLFRCRHD
jgi:hypothetical protein